MKVQVKMNTYKSHIKEIDDFIEFTMQNHVVVDQIDQIKGKIVRFSGYTGGLDNLKCIKKYLNASKLRLNYICFNTHRYSINVEYSLFSKLKGLFQ